MKILVAMSGGVDSTVTAYTLLQQGHEVEGCYMKLHGKPNYHEANIAKVEKAAQFLGIKHHILDLQDDFKERVYMPFVASYKAGKTPNPCAWCNRFIKLGKLLEFAKSLNCEKLATGHYARVENGLLKTAFDETKDQSYFLASAHKSALSYLIFPLGEKKKEAVKAFAASIKELESFATQKESAEICFVENTYIEVLQQFMPTNVKGSVLDSNGKIIGKHDGYMHYTIGKRRGFEVRGAHEPHFVLKIKPQSNEIVVGLKDELKVSEFELEKINLLVDKTFLRENKLLQNSLNAENFSFKCEVKIRYRSKSTACVVQVLPNLSAKITLLEPVYALASGQMAVFYDKDTVLASGFIN